MGEGVFTYRAENGNVCEIVDTFAETFTVMEISPANPLFIYLMMALGVKFYQPTNISLLGQFGFLC